MPWRFGLAETDKIFYAAASGVGMPIVYLGFQKPGATVSTAATMASAEFGPGRGGEAPDRAGGRSVFRKKLLLEACLEIMRKDWRHSHSGYGRRRAHVARPSRWVRKAILGSISISTTWPCRETGMSAYEMMLSESQERMLMVLKPEKEAEAEAIFRKMGGSIFAGGWRDHAKSAVFWYATAATWWLTFRSGNSAMKPPVYHRPLRGDAKAASGSRAADVPPPVSLADALESAAGEPRSLLESAGCGSNMIT